jgi:cell wall-associated NlpC family hydrolase
MVFAALLVGMVLLLPRLNKQPPALEATASQQEASQPARPVAAVYTTREGAKAVLRAPSARADSIVAFGLAQRGTPYVYAGTSPLTGFDCSGFIMFTFARFGVAVPHSTALLIDVGRPVPRAEAQPGDIVVFTGTATTSTTPGHAGIVISKAGEVPLRFVHASSARRESGVKVSQVEGSDYERRFMQVRRVLGPGEVATARPVANAAAPVRTLPAKPVAVTPPPAVAPTPPKTLSALKKAPTVAKKAVKKPVKKTAPVAKAKRPVSKKQSAASAARRKAPAKPARTAAK